MDRGYEQGHPTRKALGRARQVNKSESKKHDKNRPNRLQPSSPESVRVVLLAELDQLGASRARRRTVINGEGHYEQDNARYTAQPAKDAE